MSMKIEDRIKLDLHLREIALTCPDGYFSKLHCPKCGRELGIFNEDGKVPIVGRQ